MAKYGNYRFWVPVHKKRVFPPTLNTESEDAVRHWNSKANHYVANNVGLSTLVRDSIGDMLLQRYAASAPVEIWAGEEPTYVDARRASRTFGRGINLCGDGRTNRWCYTLLSSPIIPNRHCMGISSA